MDMAKAVKEHTDKAFDAEGYSKSSYQRWKKKKRYDGFKILHVTDVLSESTIITRQTWPTFVVVNNTPYADIHNEGTERLPRRHFLDDGPGKSPALDKKLDIIMKGHIRYIQHGK